MKAPVRQFLAVALIVSASMATARQSALIVLPAEVRTYAELARDLTRAGVSVFAGPEWERRACVVKLSSIPWEQAKNALESGLGITFTSNSTGDLVMTASSQAVESEKRELKEFTRIANASLAATIREAKNYCRGNLPADREAMMMLIAKELGNTGQQEPIADRLLASNLPAPKKNALALLYGTASQDIPEFQGSGPAFNYFYNGGGIRRLMSSDLVDAGNPYWWRDWTALPEWIRSRALVTARGIEQSLTRQNLSREEFESRLAQEIRQVAIIHRLAWDPLSGSTSFEYSISHASGVGTWYGAADMFSVSTPLTGALRSEIDVAVNEDQKWLDRVTSTKEILSEPWAQAKLEDPQARTFSSSVCRMLGSTPESFVMEISSVRDIAPPRPTEAGAGGLTRTGLWANLPESARTADARVANLLAAANATLLSSAVIVTNRTDGSQVEVQFDGRFTTVRKPPLAPSWTLRRLGGVIIARNEWQFIDHLYPVPFSKLQEVAATDSVDWNSLRVYVQGTTATENLQAARVAYGPPPARYYCAYPYLKLMESMPKTEFNRLIKNLVTNGSATISLGSLSPSTVADFLTNLTRLTLTTSRATDSSATGRHLPLHPLFQELAASGEVSITKTKGELAEVTFRLTYAPPTNGTPASKISRQEAASAALKIRNFGSE